ncbi:MAG: HDOD domain-containing protein [Marinobacter sp.]|uniref:HDOD domain-containing protein n=1 Tax=Marinobacter sp. TaxID=50741 RepID=UPI00299DD4FE|nr:HDOD domain-containing protein [Marinobacter sp.]MDX1635810.1 HDOD domain-containing protein [Marinobacter sp.]
MPRIIQWFQEVLGKRAEAPPAPPPSRLLNPAQTGSGPDNRAATEAALGKLEESLFCWLLEVGPQQLAVNDEHTEGVLAELENRVENNLLEELPRQPMTLPMLLRTMAENDSAREQLVKIILGDPALTDQVLQVANSPYFRHGEQHIESVDQAVFLMGHQGIRSVVSASIMRPMLAARNSSEALFAQRVWRWGMTCGRSAEAIARAQGGDSNSHFLLGLLPALAYMTLRREVQRLYRVRRSGQVLPPGLLYTAIRRFDWATAQVLAREWNLPPRYHASLLAAERPVPEQRHTPLNDGIILGTREVLRHAHQRNLPEEDLRQVIQLDDQQFSQIRKAIAKMLREGANPTR